MPRLIMHIDMDAFFAAIHQREDPTLKGKPVIVGAMPGNRGVVAACSYEARKFGVHSAMPISEAYRRCPNGVFLRPDGRLYSRASRQIMGILRELSPLVEPVSVDEAYVDITGLERLYGSPRDIGIKAKEIILRSTQLTASAGIGPNRQVAKIASDFDKPDGLTLVSPEEVLDFLAPMDVSRLRGVGKVMQEKLRRIGIHKVIHLRDRPKEELSRHFGASSGEHLYRQARGIASDRVGESSERKSISKERTFSEDILDMDVLLTCMREMAAKVGRTARRKELCGRCVTVKIRLEGFETHTRSRTLRKATDMDDEIFKLGWDLYEESGYAGRPVRLIGVGLSDFRETQQLDLFDEARRKKKKVLSTQDSIVERFGKDLIGVKRKQK